MTVDFSFLNSGDEALYCDLPHQKLIIARVQAIEQKQLIRHRASFTRR